MTNEQKLQILDEAKSQSRLLNCMYDEVARKFYFEDHLKNALGEDYVRVQETSKDGLPQKMQSKCYKLDKITALVYIP